jgi:hypothetical protein
MKIYYKYNLISSNFITVTLSDICEIQLMQNRQPNMPNRIKRFVELEIHDIILNSVYNI